MQAAPPSYESIRALCARHSFAVYADRQATEFALHAAAPIAEAAVPAILRDVWAFLRFPRAETVVIAGAARLFSMQAARAAGGFLIGWTVSFPPPFASFVYRAWAHPLSFETAPCAFYVGDEPDPWVLRVAETRIDVLAARAAPANRGRPTDAVQQLVVERSLRDGTLTPGSYAFLVGGIAVPPPPEGMVPALANPVRYTRIGVDHHCFTLLFTHDVYRDRVQTRRACDEAHLLAETRGLIPVAFDKCGPDAKKRSCKMYAAASVEALRAVFDGRVRRTRDRETGEERHRFMYEMLLPVRRTCLYLDLDRKDPGADPVAVGDALTAAAIEHARAAAAALFGESLSTADFLVLANDRPGKASRHIIAKRLVFETMADLRIFMHDLLRRAAACPVLAPDGDCALDAVVYKDGTQLFRPAHCAKAPAEAGGECAPLRVAAVNLFPIPPGASEFDVLLLSLVQNVDPAAPVRRFVQTGPTRFEVAGAGPPVIVEIEAEPAKGKRKRPQAAVDVTRKIAGRGGHQGLAPEAAAEVFQFLCAQLRPQWGLLAADVDKFQVRAEKGIGFTVFRLRGGGYCQIRGGNHGHRPVQFYVTRRASGRWDVVQRCAFGCAGAVDIAVAVAAPGLDNIFNRL